jgi:PilZ domain
MMPDSAQAFVSSFEKGLRIPESTGYVLAIEPHEEQASILRDDVSKTTRTRLTVVESMDAAMSAIDDELPNLVLLSALIPPHEESHLVARLRDLPQAIAPRVLFIPALARSETPQPRRTLIDRLWNRTVQPTGCTPTAFADQLSEYLAEWRPNESFAMLNPPPGAAGAERRAAARLEHVDWARVLIDGAPVDMVDLSLTGAQIVSSMVMQPGGSVDVMLSSKAGGIRCDAGIVWSAFEIIGSTQAPQVRAGIIFKNADRRALERFYFERSQHRFPRRDAEASVERGIPAAVIPVEGQTPATPPHGPSVVSQPVDRRRPRAERRERGAVPWLSTVKLPWGSDARVLNISSTGLLLESGSKVTPGSTAELKLSGPDWQIAIPACFVRSEVGPVNGLGVKYHTAAEFETPLEFPATHPLSSATSALPANTLNDAATKKKAKRAELLKRVR